MDYLTPFRIGDWTVDTIANAFERGDERVQVEPKAMQVLAVLVEHAGEVVSKDILFERVWDGRFVTDDVLTGAVGQLRRALGDDARSPSYIQTVPRRGYRLIAKVEAIDSEPPEAPASAAPWWRRRSFDRRLVVALALAVPASALLAWSARAIWDGSLVNGPLIRQEIEILAEPESSARHPDALVAYHRARLLMEEGADPTGDPLQVLEDLRHAVELDPELAEAWVLLARAHWMSRYHGVPADIGVAETLRAAHRALDIDPNLPEAHIVVGQSLLFDERDLPAAEAAFERALALAPTHARALRVRGVLRSITGRFDDALDDALEARRLDPASEPMGWEERMRYLTGERDAAIDDLKELLAARPETYYLRLTLLELLRCERRDAEAWEHTRVLQEQSGSAERLASLQAAYAEGGLARVDRVLLDALRRDREAGIELRRPIAIAELATLTGDHDLAFRELDARVDVDDSEVLFLRTRPLFDPLREDPRYDRLLERLGLAATGTPSTDR